MVMRHLQGLPNAVLSRLPKQDHLYQAVLNIFSKKTKKGLSEPKDVSEISELDLEALTTNQGASLLYADSGSDDQNRFIVLATERNMAILSQSEMISLDGTFSVRL
jgi:hypothetical protein